MASYSVPTVASTRHAFAARQILDTRSDGRLDAEPHFPRARCGHCSFGDRQVLHPARLMNSSRDKSANESVIRSKGVRKLPVDKIASGAVAGRDPIPVCRPHPRLP